MLWSLNDSTNKIKAVRIEAQKLTPIFSGHHMFGQPFLFDMLAVAIRVAQDSTESNSVAKVSMPKTLLNKNLHVMRVLITVLLNLMRIFNERNHSFTGILKMAQQLFGGVGSTIKTKSVTKKTIFVVGFTECCAINHLYKAGCIL